MYDEEGWVSGRRRRKGGVRQVFKYQPGFSVANMGGTFTRASTATYFDVNGVLQTASSGVIRDGAYVGGVLGTLLEGTRTNIVLQNRDLTNASWTKTTMTTAKDQTGIDGISNSASSLLATAGNATVLQAITLASSTRNQSAYVKRLVGSGTINMTTDGGTTWNAITVTNNWTQVTFSQTAVTNPSVGFRIVTNGDKIAVDYVQNETGTFPSSAIATTTAAVTRQLDALMFPVGFAEQAVTLYAKYIDQGSQLTGLAGIVAIGDANVKPSLFAFATTATASGADFNNGTTTQADGRLTTNISIGDTVEARILLSPTGVTQLGVTRNGASEALATPTVGQAYGSGWGSSSLFVNAHTTGTTATGYAVFLEVVVALGVQSIRAMRAV